MDFNKPFDNAVPNPEQVLGYSIGARITTYRDQERVFDALEARSGGKMTKISYGMSNGRLPLRVYAISSAKNIARWSQIQNAIDKAATSGSVPPADTPAIVWVNETIHGNEPASFESGMMLAYNLLAGKGQFTKALDNIVVILNPCYNPDGHERYAVSYNSYARGDYAEGAYEQFEVQALWGRFNQYRFDMNRDRVSFSQTETRAEVALMQKIRPQVYLDQHGQVSNYFFPPNPQSINVNVDRNRLNKWTEILGKACARGFDGMGWSYFVKEDFDFYYPGYLDAHATLSGAIGITHETDGGKALAGTRNDGSVVTLREGAAKHLMAALQCIGASGERKADLLTDWAKYKKSAVTGDHAGSFKRVILKSDSRGELKRIQEQLNRTGVNSFFVAPGSTQKATSFWTGATEDVTTDENTLIVDMAQEYGPIAKTLFEKNSDFEPEFVKSQMEKAKTAPEGENYPGAQGTEFYDMTGWALSYAHNVKAWYSDVAPVLPPGGAENGFVLPGTDLGYLLRYTGEEHVLAMADLLAQGVRASFTSAAMTLDGKQIPKGSFVVFKVRNDSDLDMKLMRVSKARQVRFEALSTSYPGVGREGLGNRLNGLTAPKIGVVFGNGAQMAGVSSLWYTMDQVFKLPYTALSSGALNSSVTLAQYSVLIAPSRSGVLSSQKVKDWVREGGVVVVLGDAPSSVASFSNGPETRSIPGAVYRAQLEPRSLLSAGYAGSEIAVPVDGASFPKARKEGGAVVKFSDESKKLLTGWSWGEESEKALSGTVWMHDEPSGRGHLVWFAQDPTDRAMWQGLHKLLLNSMILLPGN